MAKQIVCDRCGKILEPENKKSISVDYKTYDLCPSCFREFEKFLADGKKERGAKK